jgi:RHS repeat-associated protein
VGYGWLGAHERATLGAGLILMGARLYDPATGWFTGPDPVYGGNDTAYTYPTDPVNEQDLDGLRRSRKRGWRHRVGRNTYWQTGYHGVRLAADLRGLGIASRSLRAYRAGYRTYRHGRRTGNYRTTRVRFCSRGTRGRYCALEGALLASGVSDTYSRGRRYFRSARKSTRTTTRWYGRGFARMGRGYGTPTSRRYR